MAKSRTDHPTSIFGVADAAFDVLWKDGVNVRQFLQAIIDKPDFREQLVDAFKDQRVPLAPYKLPTVPHRLGVDNLLKVLFDVEQLLLDWLVQNDYADGMRQLMADLDDREISILIQRFGFVNGRLAPRSEVGETHGISPGRVQQIERHALAQMRIAYQRDQDRQHSLATTSGEPIEDLYLSERARNCLRRAQIETVGQLLEKTEDDLLAINYLGQKCTDEIIAKLAERGLALKERL